VLGLWPAEEQVSGRGVVAGVFAAAELGTSGTRRRLGLAKGVALVNAQRHEQGLEPIVDQGDHFHALWQGEVGFA